MKSLLILRHAEAATGGPHSTDELRPLTERGRSQADALGQWLRQRHVHVQAIACSAAVRARETATLVASAAKWTAAVTPVAVLYNANGADLLAHARTHAATISQLLLVAHAPGVAEAVRLLVAPQAELALVYEAATMAEIVLDIRDWSALAPGAGVLRLFLPP